MRGSEKMQVFIVSDHEATAGSVRAVFLREGMDCPAENVVSLELAVERFTRIQADLIVVVLTPDADRALAVIGQLHLLIHVPLLAIGSAGDSRLVLRTLRAG